MPIPEKIDNATVVLKANVYFDGKVVSHTVLSSDGKKRTVGLIYPGTYHFNTGAPELMEILSGRCRVVQAGAPGEKTYAAGESFRVPGNSSFDIAVETGITEYLCSFE